MSHNFKTPLFPHVDPYGMKGAAHGPAAAIIGAAVTSFGPLATPLGLFGIGTGLSAFLVRAAIGLALYALAPKPPSLSQQGRRGYQVTQRGSALDHQIIYGRARTGGVIVFDETTGTNNKFLHRVIAFAGHEIESYDEIYINDSVATLDTDGNVTSVTEPDGSTSDRYDGLVRVKQYYGTDDQTADSDLVSESSLWTNNHRLRGIAYLYIRLKFDSDAFPNGIPRFSAVIKGKKLYDPRVTGHDPDDSSTWEWSDNPALCIRDYLTQGYGLDEGNANVDDTLVQTAANVCDETPDFGDTTNATRYTCNGGFTTSVTPYDVLNDLLTSMGGTLWYAQGEWRMKAAKWTTPVITLDEDDLRSSINVSTRQSRRDNFNTVKGTFRGDETNWQITDYPEVTNSSFLSADNDQESVIDFDLPFTDNSIEARRLARIFLERNRQQLTVNASFGMRAFQVQVGDNVRLTNSRFGWTEKEFEVVEWTFGLTDAMDLQVQMTLRETAETVFDELDDGEVYERDNTTLLSPFLVPGVGISVTTETKVIREKLTNVATVSVSSGSSERVDYVEVQFKKSSDSIWSSAGTGELGDFQVIDLEDGDYDFRARAVNTLGVKGEWESIFNVNASGLLDPPEDVSGFIAEVSSGILVLTWDAVADLDLSYYRIRFSPDSGNGTWANSIDYINKVPRPATDISVPARAGDFLIRAYDKSGVASENYTTVTVPSGDLESYTNTLSQAEAPSFSGSKTNVVVDTNNELQLDSFSTAPSTGTYEFSTYIDVGSVTRCRVYVDAINERADTTAGLFDDQPGNFDDAPGLFDDAGGDTQFSDTNVVTYVSTTDDDPAGTPTWSDWRVLKAADISARAFRFKVDLTSSSDNVTPSVPTLTAYVKYN